MKKYYLSDGIYYSGSTEEIRKLLKCFRRAEKKGQTRYTIPYKKPAIFSKKKKQYALHLDSNSNIHVLSSDEMLNVLDR